MARPQRPWFRVYVEMMRDPKLRRLTPPQRWLWVAVLAASRESFIPGFLMVSERVPFTASDLADYSGMKRRDVEVGLKDMETLGLISMDTNLGAWSVPRWSERQYESDDVTARTTKHRSKERRWNVPKPFPGTPPETETETETDVGGLTVPLQAANGKSRPPVEVDRPKPIGDSLTHITGGRP